MNEGAGLKSATETDDSAQNQLGMGLQLLRASNLTMTRLHLALQSGDRRLAMMAVDGLIDIDAEIESFVSGLVTHPGNDAHWDALAAYLEQQKTAIATEKHALVGQVGVPADAPAPLAVPEEFPAGVAAIEPIALQQEDAVEEELDSPSKPRRLILLLLAILLIGALAAALLFEWRPS